MTRNLPSLLQKLGNAWFSFDLTLVWNIEKLCLWWGRLTADYVEKAETTRKMSCFKYKNTKINIKTYQNIFAYFCSPNFFPVDKSPYLSSILRCLCYVVIKKNFTFPIRWWRYSWINDTGRSWVYFQVFLQEFSLELGDTLMLKTCLQFEWVFCSLFSDFIFYKLLQNSYLEALSASQNS